MKWISVKDLLPEDREAHHLITDGKVVTEAQYTYWSPYYAWILPSGMQKVTHWMPLPEPPKE